MLTRRLVVVRSFLFLRFHPPCISSPRSSDDPGRHPIREKSGEAGQRRRAKSRYMMRAAVTCKSGQSPTPLRFQIFKVCLDSSRRPRRWSRISSNIEPSLSFSLEQNNSKKEKKKEKGNFSLLGDNAIDGKERKKERKEGLETRSTIIVKSSTTGVRGSRGRFPERIGRAKGDAWQQPRNRGSVETRGAIVRRGRSIGTRDEFLPPSMSTRRPSLFRSTFDSCGRAGRSAQPTSRFIYTGGPINGGGGQKGDRVRGWSTPQLDPPRRRRGRMEKSRRREIRIRGLPPRSFEISPSWRRERGREKNWSVRKSDKKGLSGVLSGLVRPAPFCSIRSHERTTLADVRSPSRLSLSLLPRGRERLPIAGRSGTKRRNTLVSRYSVSCRGPPRACACPFAAAHRSGTPALTRRSR